jgi:hypothetical protein
MALRPPWTPPRLQATSSTRSRPVTVLRVTSSRGSAVPLLSPRNHHQGIVWKRPLELQCYRRGRRHPHVYLVRCRQNYRHRFQVNRTDRLVRLSSEERKDIVSRLAFLNLSNRGPICTYPGKNPERTGLVESEPDWRLLPSGSAARRSSSRYFLRPGQRSNRPQSRAMTRLLYGVCILGQHFPHCQMATRFPHCVSLDCKYQTDCAEIRFPNFVERMDFLCRVTIEIDARPVARIRAYGRNRFTQNVTA